MPNAHLVEVGDAFCEVAQVGKVEVMPCVDAQTGVVRPSCRLGIRLSGLAPNAGMFFGEGLGVQLDAVCPCGSGGLDLGLVGFDEQRRADAACAEGRQDVLEHVEVVCHRPTGIAGQDVRRVGNQGHLLGSHLADEIHKVLAGISLNVEFGVNHGPQVAHIGIGDVAGVGTRMNRDALSAESLNAFGRFDDIRFRAAPGVAQGGDFVYVDAEPCHTYLWVKERNYTMRAQRMLSLDLPVLALTDPVSRALTVMDEFKLMHLPVVEEDVYKGTVSEATLLELDESALIAEAPMIQDAIPHDLHVYDVVARMGWSDVDVLPVVHEGLYRGAVDRAAVLRFMAKRAGWGFPGSTLVLEVLSKDLSPAELVRIVEADGAQITSFNVAPVEDSEFLEVTFKVNTEEIESLMATLRRHEYQVQSFYNAPELEDEMRARFDAFMRYLEP